MFTLIMIYDDEKKKYNYGVAADVDHHYAVISFQSAGAFWIRDSGRLVRSRCRAKSSRTDRPNVSLSNSVRASRNIVSAANITRN